MDPVHPTDIAFWYALPIVTGLFLLATAFFFYGDGFEKVSASLVRHAERMREITGFLVEWL
jgi:hypothetical protein